MLLFCACVFFREHSACTADYQTQPAGPTSVTKSLSRLLQENLPALAALAAHPAHPAAIILFTSTAQMIAMSANCHTTKRLLMDFFFNELKNRKTSAQLNNYIFFPRDYFIRNFLLGLIAHKHLLDLLKD